MKDLVSLLVDGSAESLCAESVRIEHRLSQHGRLVARFRGRGQRQIDPSSLLGRPLTVEWRDESGEKVTLFEGIIHRCRLSWTGGIDATGGILEAATESAALSSTRHWRTFLDSDVLDIASEICPSIGFGSGVSGATYPQVFQYGETDWQFLLRLCDWNGWYVITHAGTPRIEGLLSSGDTLDMDIHTLLDSYEVEVQTGLGSSQGLYQDVSAFQWDTPQRSTDFPSELDSPDGAVGCAQQATDQADLATEHAHLQRDFHASSADLDAAVQREQHRSTSTIARGWGVSRQPRICPGVRVRVAGTAHNNGHAAVVAVVHHFEGEAGERVPGYWNEFETTYMDAYFALPEPAMARAPGVVTGIVRENNDTEGLGRLRVSFGWQGSEQTRWIRRLTLYAGKEKGVFFTPEVGEEVLLAFEDGDLERPIVIGAPWSGKHPTDPTSRDSDNNVKSIVTRSGHRVEFHEDGGSEKIYVQTPEALCTVTMTNGGGAAVDVYTKGRVSVTADEGEITITAHQSDISVTADQGNIRVTAEQGSMDIHSEKDMKFTSNASISIEALHGQVSVLAESVDIRANKDISVQGATASLSLDNLFEVKSGGNATIEASSKASIKGSMIDLNGR